jgi:hypothetical protein
MRVGCLTSVAKTHQDEVAERISLVPYNPSRTLQLLTIKIEVRNPKQSQKRSARPEPAVGTE